MDDEPGAELILARDLSRLHYDDPAARRAAARGELVRIRRGVYVRTERWQMLSADQRYRAFCRAVALTAGDECVLSHDSAAALHGLPLLGAVPRPVHVVNDRSDGGASRRGVRGHVLRLDREDVVCVDGVAVTSMRRTLIDIAATSSAHSAVAMLDHALHVDRWGRARTGIDRADLLAALAASGLGRGQVRARTRIEFADPAAGSVLESASRVTIAMLGLAPPQLQRTFAVPGGEADVDFYWEGVDAVGEVDGAVKYLDPEYRGGRSADRVVYDEKLREDAIRRQVRSFTRWGSREAMSVDLLRARLAPLRLPMARRRPPREARRGGFG